MNITASEYRVPARAADRYGRFYNTAAKLV
jgi:hypothetical protein